MRLQFEIVLINGSFLAKRIHKLSFRITVLEQGMHYRNRFYRVLFRNLLNSTLCHVRMWLLDSWRNHVEYHRPPPAALILLVIKERMTQLF